jgi:hypothetical protein
MTNLFASVLLCSSFFQGARANDAFNLQGIWIWGGYYGYPPACQTVEFKDGAFLQRLNDKIVRKGTWRINQKGTLKILQLLYEDGIVLTHAYYLDGNTLTLWHDLPENNPFKTFGGKINWKRTTLSDLHLNLWLAGP